MKRIDFYLGISLLILTYSSIVIGQEFSLDGLSDYNHFLTTSCRAVFVINFLSIISVIICLIKLYRDKKKAGNIEKM